MYYIINFSSSEFRKVFFPILTVLKQEDLSLVSALFFDSIDRVVSTNKYRSGYSLESIVIVVYYIINFSSSEFRKVFFPILTVLKQEDLSLVSALFFDSIDRVVSTNKYRSGYSLESIVIVVYYIVYWRTE